MLPACSPAALPPCCTARACRCPRCHAAPARQPADHAPRPGTPAQLQHIVPVRPFKHNEYERFLLAAYPYYASAFSTMAAFFLFGFFFLYHK